MSGVRDVTQAVPVTDGRRVRWTLEQARQETQTAVRIDWLRFTLPVEAVLVTEYVQAPDIALIASLERAEREAVLMARHMAGHQDSGAMVLARQTAEVVCTLLGGAFEVGAVEDRAMDYYAARCSIVHHGAIVGHALAGAQDRDRSRASSQARTVHVNLHGEACLHVSHAKWAGMKTFISDSKGHLTRIDLACDIFDGFDIERVSEAWKSGQFDVRGKRPSQRNVGSWDSGHSRSYYVGVRESGKMARFYEKGDQLFGHEAADPWLRGEVEFRREHRVLDLEMLTRPADFFAGAYPFCQDFLEFAGEAFAADSCKTSAKGLAAKTCEAAVAASARFVEKVCAASCVALFRHSPDKFEELVRQKWDALPGLLKGWSRAAIDKAAGSLAPEPAPLAIGAVG